MTEAASVAQKHFFAPSWRTLLPPLTLVVFAALPVLLLRWTLYALLAAPLMVLLMDYVQWSIDQSQDMGRMERYSQ